MPGSGSRNGARHLYRITARSRGGHPDAVRVLQSTFAARGH
ncbi:MAG: pilus assembly protein [Xanthomonadaceae bacterium]|nr:pilus assembly protein [Xanthomonadaceae bacterium]